MRIPEFPTFQVADPINPFLRRWMLFVDGENLTFRGQELASSKTIDLTPGEFYEPDVFLWFRESGNVTYRFDRHLRGLSTRPVAERAYYYTSMTGDSDSINDVNNRLWQLGFTPEVFKKNRKNMKAKGVDIALTKDLLSNAFMNNYDLAVVITGDADYKPVFQELRRLGKSICLLSITGASARISPELKLSADYFISIDDPLLTFWKRPG